MPEFGDLSIAQLQKHIRATSRDTAHVFLTSHARTQMATRKVADLEVYECVQKGRILRTPEPDMKTGHLVCRMEHYCAGRNLTVCVALDDKNPDLLIVTVFAT